LIAALPSVGSYNKHSIKLHVILYDLLCKPTKLFISTVWRERVHAQRITDADRSNSPDIGFYTSRLHIELEIISDKL